MYKRIIIIVSSALFSLLALLSIIIIDLYDRDFPKAIETKSRLNIQFDESSLLTNEAFSLLEKLDLKWNLGLLKIAPDLARDGEGQVFAHLNDEDLPRKFTWFNGSSGGKVVGKDRLANSYPDGFYLVTGDTTYLEEFEQALQSEGINVSRKDASIIDSLMFIVQERGFATAVLAAFTLIITLSLFWLTLRSRGRALRVLAGSPTVRIQIQDLAGFVGALLISATTIALVSTIYVGFFHGWLYVYTFLQTLMSLEVTVIVISLIAALLMSATAWPSATMLATRQPAVKSLRTAAIVIQALTFLLVVAAASPAWLAYKHSSTMATEMAQWKQLSDQVAIVFATKVNEMDYMEPMIGELIKDADFHNQTAFSYTYTQEMWPSLDFKDFSAISFVNQRWLDLVVKNNTENAKLTTPIPNHTISQDIYKEIREEAEFLSREGISDELFSEFQFLQPSEGFRIPVAQAGGGERLSFVNDVLLVVVPSIYKVYNDSALTSMISGSNIIFTGVTDTQELLKKHNLDVQSLRNEGIEGELNVVYVAEEGILLAQYAEYVVWLLNLSLLALVIAFTVAVAISAWISALLQTKRDFPLRLAGMSWREILISRVTRELLVGIALTAIVIFIQNPDEIWPVLIVVAYGLLVVPLSHLFAARWCFNGVSKRQIR